MGLCRVELYVKPLQFKKFQIFYIKPEYEIKPIVGLYIESNKKDFLTFFIYEKDIKKNLIEINIDEDYIIV